MKPRAYITTSWDDGHPLDLRLAELLSKYNLPATFYIPLGNELPVMTHSQMRELSTEFEVGGHTLNHCDLVTMPDDVTRREIIDCKNMLEEICGHSCTSFCFPKGHFRGNHIKNVREAGFRMARTVELMSVDLPWTRDGIAMMPTTLQVGPSGFSRVARNSIKRFRPMNLYRHVRYSKSNWVATSEALLEHVLSFGGVFHLWGHSWEVDQMGEWENLERVFSMLSQCEGRAVLTSNSGLLDAAIS
jgi:peptidoglycan/xylan/chitin deacetylase (PgdA/CDA1 family)